MRKNGLLIACASVVASIGMASAQTPAAQPPATPMERVEGLGGFFFKAKEPTNLDAMVAQLRRADITVEVDPETYPNGLFARLADPEGNPIQLWQPAAKQRQ